jgi:CheY-like chemotaxis protein
LEYLQDTLEGCHIVGCPLGYQARTFIERIKYSLFLFDEELPDMTCEELADFARQFPERKKTPILIIKKSDNPELLARTIVRMLSTPH